MNDPENSTRTRFFASLALILVAYGTVIAAFFTAIGIYLILGSAACALAALAVLGKLRGKGFLILKIAAYSDLAAVAAVIIGWIILTA